MKYRVYIWGDKTVIVKIDPADVISVPDSDCSKMRVCFYEVVSDFAGELPPFVAIGQQPYAKESFVKRVLRKIFGND